MNAVVNLRYPEEYEVRQKWDVHSHPFDFWVKELSNAKFGAVPMWNFQSNNTSVASDHAVLVEFGAYGSEIVAECERLRVYAMGKTRDEALSDLQAQVVYFFGHYSSLGEDDVIGDAVELRKLYQEHFKKA